MNTDTSSTQGLDIDYHQVLASLPDAVMVIDNDFNVLLVNDAFTRLTGVDPSRAVGKKCYDDGSGYPQGLKGEAILLEARILAVADVLDAITCFRPYRPAMGLEAALVQLKTQRGKQFDGTVVDACVRVLSTGRVELGLAARTSEPAAGMTYQTKGGDDDEHDIYKRD